MTDAIGPLDILFDEVKVNIRLGGKTYSIRKLTMGDMAALQGYLKGQFGRPVTAEEVFGELKTPEGMTFVLWRRVHAVDPDMTLEDMRDVIPTTTEAIDSMAEALGIKATGDDAENPPKAATQ